MDLTKTEYIIHSDFLSPDFTSTPQDWTNPASRSFDLSIPGEKPDDQIPDPNSVDFFQGTFQAPIPHISDETRHALAFQKKCTFLTSQRLSKIQLFAGDPHPKVIQSEKWQLFQYLCISDSYDSHVV